MMTTISLARSRVAWARMVRAVGSAAPARSLSAQESDGGVTAATLAARAAIAASVEADAALVRAVGVGGVGRPAFLATLAAARCGVAYRVYAAAVRAIGRGDLA
jgi:hypothetical protein